MKRNLAILFVVVLVIVGAAIGFIKLFFVPKQAGSISIIGGADGPTTIFLAGKLADKEEEMIGYTSISMDEVEAVWAESENYIILDVRRADEFAEGHIPGAINVANEDISTVEPAELPDKDQVIFVYCRSGNRSKQAAKKLTDMGYKNIVEFGGIIDWDGEIEK